MPARRDPVLPAGQGKACPTRTGRPSQQRSAPSRREGSGWFRRPGRRPVPLGGRYASSRLKACRRRRRHETAIAIACLVDVGQRRRSAWRVLGARLSRETSVCLEKLGVRGSVRPQPATRQPRASRRRGRSPGGAAEQASASYNRRKAALETGQGLPARGDRPAQRRSEGADRAGGRVPEAPSPGLTAALVQAARDDCAVLRSGTARWLTECAGWLVRTDREADERDDHRPDDEDRQE